MLTRLLEQLGALQLPHAVSAHMSATNTHNVLHEPHMHKCAGHELTLLRRRGWAGGCGANYRGLQRALRSALAGQCFMSPLTQSMRWMALPSVPHEPVEKEEHHQDH